MISKKQFSQIINDIGLVVNKGEAKSSINCLSNENRRLKRFNNKVKKYTLTESQKSHIKKVLGL